MHLSQHNLCTRKTELALGLKISSRLSPSLITWPWRRKLTNGVTSNTYFGGVQHRALSGWCFVTTNLDSATSLGSRCRCPRYCRRCRGRRRRLMRAVQAFRFRVFPSAPCVRTLWRPPPTPSHLLVCVVLFRLRRAVQVFLLLAASPPVVFALLSTAFHYLSSVGHRNFPDLATATMNSLYSGTLSAIRDANLLGTWSFGIVSLGIFPNWLMFWHLAYQ